MRLAIPLALALVVAACGSAATAPSPTPARTTARAAATTAPPSPSPACATAGDVGKPVARATIVLERGGEIVIALRADKAPNTVATFARNARECRYDRLTFHRVEQWVIQGGDPLGTGSGGGTQPTELSDLPFTAGAVGIARGGDIRVSNAMQFFIVLTDARHLDNAYTNFGRVTAGQDVAARVQRGERIRTIRID